MPGPNIGAVRKIGGKSMTHAAEHAAETHNKCSY